MVRQTTPQILMPENSLRLQQPAQNAMRKPKLNKTPAPNEMPSKIMMVPSWRSDLSASMLAAWITLLRGCLSSQLSFQEIVGLDQNAYSMRYFSPSLE